MDVPTQEERKKIQYLSRYQKLEKRIRQLSDERAVWLSKACRVTQVLSDMPRVQDSTVGNSCEADRYVELTEEITLELQELHKLRREIRDTIKGLEDDTLQTLLLYRYIDGLTWEQIAEKMFYTPTWVWILHRRALGKIKIQKS